MVFRQVFVSVATFFSNVAANNCVLDDEDLIVVAVVFVVVPNAEGAKSAVTSTWLIVATTSASEREVSLKGNVFMDAHGPWLSVVPF
jgi:hypothetical protein